MTSAHESAHDTFDSVLRLAQESTAERRYEDALRQVLDALRLAEAQGDPLQQSRAHAQHSRILFRLSLYVEAVSAGHLALRFAGDDPASAARALGALGAANQTLTPPEAQFKHYDTMLAKARQAGDAGLEASAIRGLCIANLIQYEVNLQRGHDAAQPDMRGYLSEALRLSLDATHLSRGHGDVGSVFLGQHLRVGALVWAGDLDAARRESEEMLRAATTVELVAEQDADRVIALKHLGDIDLLEGKLAAAEERLTEALAICEVQKDLRKAADCMRALSVVTECKGDYKSALHWQRRSSDAFMHFASASARAHASAMEVREGAEHARALAAAQQERADRLERSNQELARKAEQHERSALEDALTGIANRRRLDIELAALVVDPRARRWCSLALLDIDHFKWVNDNLLHTTGDKVLARIGAVLRECSRGKDIVARFGGEEFAIVFVDVDPSEVANACERIRAAIAGVNWSELHVELKKVTVSMGFAHFDEGGERVEELVKVADARLFQAKRTGRNRVVGPSEVR